MDKIFRRPTQFSNTNKKKRDEHARNRNIIMNFRVSYEEKEKIDERIEISGLSKSEFFINSCLNQQITVIGNIKTFSVMADRLQEIKKSIDSIAENKNIAPEHIESLRMIQEILNNAKFNNANSTADKTN